MDDGRLRAVLTAVDRGSFSKAAAELGYTQSAMTHLVNNLEAELGCTLLNRGSHGVRLSEEGEQLLPYIKGVIDACNALRQEAAAQNRTQRHQLSLGCFASIARARLPELPDDIGEDGQMRLNEAGEVVDPMGDTEAPAQTDAGESADV